MKRVHQIPYYILNHKNIIDDMMILFSITMVKIKRYLFCICWRLPRETILFEVLHSLN